LGDARNQGALGAHDQNENSGDHDANQVDHELKGRPRGDVPVSEDRCHDGERAARYPVRSKI
jgi:hypothetical protein